MKLFSAHLDLLALSDAGLPTAKVTKIVGTSPTDTSVELTTKHAGVAVTVDVPKVDVAVIHVGGMLDFSIEGDLMTYQAPVKAATTPAASGALSTGASCNESQQPNF